MKRPRKPIRRFWRVISGGAALVLLAILTANCWIIARAHPHLATSREGFAQFEHVLILGTDEPDAIKCRTEALLRIYSPGQMVIISGSSNNKGVNEVEMIAQALAAKGMEPTKIIKDVNGTRTFLSMKNASQIAGLRKLAIVTDQYHVHRAVYLAKAFGFEAKGAGASGRSLTAVYAWSNMREVISRCLAIWDVRKIKHDDARR